MLAAIAAIAEQLAIKVDGNVISGTCFTTTERGPTQRGEWRVRRVMP